MPTPYQLARMVQTATDAGATHLFIARDNLDPDRQYPIPVYPGTNPHNVLHSDPANLIKCYALQDQALPIEAQLAERRPWHLGPVPATPPPVDQDSADAIAAVRACDGRPARSAAPQASTPVTITELKAAYEELRSTRARTFSPLNARGEYREYEQARDRLRELALAAYEQARISPLKVRTATGLRPEDVAPLSRPYRAAATWETTASQSAEVGG